jgi:hypothetical protein
MIISFVNVACMRKKAEKINFLLVPKKLAIFEMNNVSYAVLQICQNKRGLTRSS